MTGQLPWPDRYRSKGGGDVANSREQLETVAGQLWTVTRLVAASTLDIPNMEFKLAAGELLHGLVRGAARIERRSIELGGGGLTKRGQAQQARLAEALRTDPVPGRLTLIGRRWLPDVQSALMELHAECDPLLDAPSADAVLATHDQLARMLPWFAEASETVGGTAAPLESEGGGTIPVTRPQEGLVGPPARPQYGARDDRFSTFADTRDYRSSSAWPSSLSEYESTLIEMAWINRDELDAVETFALVLFDLVEVADLEVLEHLARLAWDESRHAAIGHEVLEAAGVPGFTLPSSLIGIELRGAMDGWDAWAQITLFGELSIIRPMRAIAAAAREVGDSEVAARFDFVCSDEKSHLAVSRRLLEAHHPGGDLEVIAEHVRELSGQILEEMGVMAQEHYAKLSKVELFRMFGE